MKFFCGTISLLLFLLCLESGFAQSADKITMRLRVVCNNGPGGVITIAVDLKKFAGGTYVGGYGVNFRYNGQKMVFNSTVARYLTQYWGFFYDAFDNSDPNLPRVVQQKANTPSNALPLGSSYFTPTQNCSGTPLNDGFYELLRFNLTISGSAQGTADFTFGSWLSYKSGGGAPGAYETFTWNANLNDNYNDVRLELFGVIVPVELVAFEAVPLPDGKVRLSWQTVTETSNLGFEIERQHDDMWQTVGFVQGMGNSSRTTDYSFIDSPATEERGDVFSTNGNINYRLKQIDVDGKTSYSAIVIVELLPQYFALGQSYPNPMSQSLVSGINIPYQLAVESIVNLSVYNSLGQTVADLARNKKQSAGYHTVKWDGRMINGVRLKSGVYFYRFIATMNNGENISRVKRFVVID